MDCFTFLLRKSYISYLGHCNNSIDDMKQLPYWVVKEVPKEMPKIIPKEEEKTPPPAISYVITITIEQENHNYEYKSAEEFAKANSLSQEERKKITSKLDRNRLIKGFGGKYNEMLLPVLNEALDERFDEQQTLLAISKVLIRETSNQHSTKNSKEKTKTTKKSNKTKKFKTSLD